jgi:hypothetical protein
MAARPILRAFAKHVEENGGDDFVFDRIREGLSMAEVARACGASSRGLLYVWINQDKEVRRRKLREARSEGADIIAEEAGEILDTLATSGGVVTSVDVQLGTARARYRQWLAGVRNREEYGDASPVAVTVNVANLHLDALRAHGPASLPTPKQPVLEAVDADFEVETDPPDLEVGDEIAELLA